MNTKTLGILGGWSGSAILLLVLVISEMGSHIIGGDWGAFLYVTFHFILIPIFSVIVVGVTGFKVNKMQQQLPRVVSSLAVIIPLSIIYLTVTGSTWLTELFKIDFNR